MAYLSAVTLLWAFSFSLIGVYLAGQVDSWFSVFMRVALASLVFIPFLKFRGVSKSLIAKLMTVGGFQLGLMYCFYYQSFLLLSVPGRESRQLATGKEKAKTISFGMGGRLVADRKSTRLNSSHRT